MGVNLAKGIFKMKNSEETTNAIRLLKNKKLDFTVHNYIGNGAVGGMEIADVLKENPDQVFKTLVTSGKSGEHYVFVIPVNGELDLKKAAKACGEKAVAMIKQKELLPLTGYIRGGCSPIGMKKHFPTFIHETCMEFPFIFVSAGVRGLQIKLSPQDLINQSRATICRLFTE